MTLEARNEAAAANAGTSPGFKSDAIAPAWLHSAVNKATAMNADPTNRRTNGGLVFLPGLAVGVVCYLVAEFLVPRQVTRPGDHDLLLADRLGFRLHGGAQRGGRHGHDGPRCHLGLHPELHHNDVAGWPDCPGAFQRSLFRADPLGGGSDASEGSRV